MKKIFVFICVHLWTIFLSVSIGAQDFKTLQDGIEYAEITRGTEKEPIRANLLRLNLTKVRLNVTHAMDTAIGVERTSSMATRHGAFAAINAGFFRLDNSIFAGDSVGVLMIDGKLLSESQNNRTALLIKNEFNSTKIAIQKLKSEIILEHKKNFISATGINRQRKDEDFIIYTPFFNRTTLTDNNGIEAIVRKNRIVQVYREKGSNLIPSDGYIISVSGKYAKNFNFKIGDKLKYKEGGLFAAIGEKINFDKTIYNEDITNGVPQLIKNGKIKITWQEEKAGKEFTENKHPRTAVAKLKDGKLLMVTVDGRQPNHSVGMNLQELAEFLLELGAVDAMNLDGGGSTTMFLDGKIVNKPSDKEGERKVSDAILVFPRNKK